MSKSKPPSHASESKRTSNLDRTLRRRALALFFKRSAMTSNAMGNNPGEGSRVDVAMLETLAEWSRTIAEYLTSNAPPHSAAAHMELGEIIARTRQKRDLRGMRTIAKDLAEWARFLPPALANQLDGLLRAKFGKGLREARQADLKRVQKS